jgi:glycosyltransferase involved in cell wall biosynthesis
VRWVVAAPGPSFSVADVHRGWVEALREQGQHVIEFGLDERLTFYGSALRQTGEQTFTRMLTAEQSYELAVNGLYATLYKSWPDVLLIVSGFFIPPDLLDRARRSRTRVVILHTEEPYEFDRQIKLAPYADVNLIDDPTNLDKFRALAPTWYVPKAYRPAIHHPGPPVPELVCDLGFVGTGFPSRVAFLEQMDLTGLDVLLAGNWQSVGEDSPLYPFLAHDPDECLDNDKTADVYRSARVGLNLYRTEAQRPELSAGWSMGPRELEMAACGLFFLRDHRGEGDEVLGMLPTFDSPQEASDLLRYWLGRPEERKALAAKAREAVADRTFLNHAAELLRLFDA